jgi:hypothetical protein
VSSAFDKLIDAVADAVREYDRSNDHLRHEPGADCIRCQLLQALPGYARGLEGKLDAFRWVVAITVDPIWVADGLDLTKERMHRIMLRAIGWAREGEVDCEILSAPDPTRIRSEQGYKPTGESCAR